MNLQLDDIRYFLAIGRVGQVRRAASQLGVSQPAVTKGLQRLERELGFALFERGARGMTLTQAGELFHAKARGLESALNDAVREATEVHLGAIGLLRVGLSPLYTDSLFMPAFLQLHEQRPGARVRLTINLNDELWRLLRQGDLDLIVSSLPQVIPEDLQTLPLIRDDLQMVARTGHPLLSRRRLRLGDLAAADWLLPPRSVALRRTIDARFDEAGVPLPRVVLEVNSSSSQLRQVLLNSDLLAVVSESTLHSAAGQGLSVLPVAQGRIHRMIGVTTLAAQSHGPLTERFIELLAQTAQGIVQDQARQPRGHSKPDGG